jgi:hypothetical protein
MPHPNDFSPSSLEGPQFLITAIKNVYFSYYNNSTILAKQALMVYWSLHLPFMPEARVQFPTAATLRFLTFSSPPFMAVIYL